MEPFEIPVTINAELRKYQQDGVNWLYFLAKYQLHGILCDGEWYAFGCVENFLLKLLLRHGSWKDATVYLHPLQHPS